MPIGASVVEGQNIVEPIVVLSSIPEAGRYSSYICRRILRILDATCCGDQVIFQL